MFGYLDLDFREDKQFKTYRCSLCTVLGKEYGSFARFLTNYEMALCLQLSSSFGQKKRFTRKSLCPMLTHYDELKDSSELLRYLSAVSVILTSEKVVDDQYDENRKYPRKIVGWIEKTRAKAEKILMALGFDSLVISRAFEQQRGLEIINADLLGLTKPTAEVLAYIYGHAAIVSNTPMNITSFQKIGHALGQILYLMDAVADYPHDRLKKVFNPLQSCSFSKDRHVSVISGESFAGAFRIMDKASFDIRKALLDLPQVDYVDELLIRRLNAKVERLRLSQNDMEQCRPIDVWDMIISSAPFALLSSPRIAFAADGKGGGSCAESVTFLVIMIMAYVFICKGFCGNCGSSTPNKVTVDHGCGGIKTYKRDPCTGKYKDDGCC